jgi:hypothetical protein
LALYNSKLLLKKEDNNGWNLKKVWAKRIFFANSACNEIGSQLIDIGTAAEINLLSEILLFSTQNVPPVNGWLTGIYLDPHNLFSPATDSAKK